MKFPSNEPLAKDNADAPAISDQASENTLSIT